MGNQFWNQLYLTTRNARPFCIVDVDEQSKNDLKEIYMQHDRSLLVSGL